MTKPESLQSSNRLWPRSTSLLLLLVGFMLSAISFAAVVNMGELAWHPARDAELRATYEAYQDTGALLIKPTGSGSYGVQAPAPGPLTSATWDDDPGSYLIASLMSHVTNSNSPYPGLALAQAFLVAIPLLWLPMAVARTLKSARAGYALILLPAVVWLVNYGTILLGTEYGLADSVSTLRVYALYGIAASLAFLSISLILLLSTYRLRTSVLITATLLIGVIAGFGNLSRSLSGMGVAATVGILWWLHVRGRWRWAAAGLASIIAIVLAVTIQNGVMTMVNSARVQTTGQSIEEIPDAHTAWHSLYLGLSYPQPITGAPSRFGVTWSDEFGWAKAREVVPEVLVASVEYDEVMKSLYIERVSSDPVGALKLYVLKGIYLLEHFGAMIALIVAGFAIGFVRIARLRKPLGIVVAISTPTLILGLVPPVLVMPMLYYYSELSAALGLLTAVSLGVLVWLLTSLPSRVRGQERRRLHDRPSVGLTPIAPAMGISAVVPYLNDAESLIATVTNLASHLTSQDEIVVVDTTSADSTPDQLNLLSQDWVHACRLVVLTSQPGRDDALRTGVLASSGHKLLIVGDALPIEFTDIDEVGDLTNEVLLLTLSAYRDSKTPTGRQFPPQTRGSKFMLEALLESHGAGDHHTLMVDGDWGRAFAGLSREAGNLWITELVLVAEQQGFSVRQAQPEASAGKKTTPLFRLSGSWRFLTGMARLALHKDEFRDEIWVPRTEK